MLSLQFRQKSSSAPSYSSRGSLAGIVTSLGLPRIASVIMSGQPNRPFPDDMKVDLQDMFEGGKQAVGIVTEALAGGDFTALPGLVSTDCLAGLRQSLAQLGPLDEQQAALLVVRPEDVFFAFIPEFRIENGAQNLLLVTFSLPGLSEMKEKQNINKTIKKQFDEEISKKLMDVKEGNLKKENFSVAVKEELTEAEKRLKENDVFTKFQETEIVIGNFRFERPRPEADWTIVELAQVNSVDVWAWPFRKRWKGRLGISLRGGFNFNNVLRMDYITDWLAVIFCLNILLTGSMTGPSVGMPPQ